MVANGTRAGGANLSNLANCLVHVIVAGNHQAQTSYAKSKYGSGHRSKQ